MSLDYSEYVPLASDLGPGETVRHNHDACGDTRQRLYVTRSDDGKYVLGYCHNCGVGGRSNLRSARLPRSTEGSGRVVLPPKALFLPSGVTAEPTEWSYDARRWLLGYDIDLTNTDPYVYWDRGSESLILAAWSSEGLEGYQSRSFRRGWDGPKYMTYRRAGAKLPQPVGNCDDLAVIVEDTVSALKVMQAGYTGIPMWRTASDFENLLTLSLKYDKIVVWLDNDNPTVRQHAIGLYRRLAAYKGGSNVEIILDKADPKCYNITSYI